MSIMGFEDEAEQSFGRPCRQTNGRSKRTCELTFCAALRSDERQVQADIRTHLIHRPPKDTSPGDCSSITCVLPQCCPSRLFFPPQRPANHSLQAVSPWPHDTPAGASFIVAFTVILHG